MPFTPAHPAIVLPFLKAKRVSATALVIGSMVPDFEYFFRMSVRGEYSHTIFGIFYFDIPVTIALAFLFHQTIKENLINNLPIFFQERLWPLKAFDFKQHFKKHWLNFLICAAVGSFLHIFWDSFTHLNGFFVQRIPSLKEVVIPFQGARYPLFYTLQHISTYTGLVIISFYIFSIKPDRVAQFSKPNLSYWLILVVVSLGVLFLRFNWAPESFNLGNAVVSSISGICISLFVVGRMRFTNPLHTEPN